MSEPRIASELIMDVVCQEHSSSINCQFCKRTHFSHEAIDVVELRAKAVEFPGKYLESEDDAVAWGYLDGRQYVWRCPCNSAARYEDFIWRHRELIATYLKRRAAENAVYAKSDTELVADLI